ncbi:DUF2231 domain-containing protein [Bacillus sp. 03113]|uniref:DUF2231 domain-containing protein n=1 Tax=Bacillus sp. 03113 TaxID=2578211 RepID=UPI00215BA7EF|nr:DUF2231 domain-containing protein [Bacillus sp. 03113]
MLSTPLHPLLVHFPIALLIMGVIAQFLALWKKDFFDKLALFLFSSGLFTGILSYLTGDGAEEFAERNGNEISSIVHIHERYALITLLIFGVIVALKIVRHYRKQSFLLPLILIFCIAGATTLTLTGHYGGKMVYHPTSQSGSIFYEEKEDRE